MCGESWHHERSLTHHPSSQGWASGVLLFCVCVVFVTLMCAFGCLLGVGCWKLPSLLSWCVMHMCFHVYVRKVYMYMYIYVCIYDMYTPDSLFSECLLKTFQLLSEYCLFDPSSGDTHCTCIHIDTMHI